MAEQQFSEAAVLALSDHTDICRELHTAGFDFIDNGKWWRPREVSSDYSPGQWSVDCQADGDGHEVLVFSIHGNDANSYGISYGVTLCGKPRSVLYWTGHEDPALTGEDPDWPGLPAAVLKARRLHQQRKEEGQS